MKVLGMIFLLLSFVLVYVVYAAGNPPDKTIDKLTIDPKTVLQLPDNATPKDKKKAEHKYLLLKAKQKEDKRKNKNGN